MPARFVRTGQMAAIGLIAAAVFPAFAQDQAPDRRVAPVPIVSVPLDGDAVSDQGLRKSVLDILQQLEQLQSQVRQLRDSVEVQAHDLQVLQTRQRDLIADLDRRVSALEAQGSAPGAEPSAGAAVAAQAGLQATTPAQQQDYDAAFGLMKQGYYDRAIKAFRAFITKYPNAALADNAQYWIAEGNYVMGNYKLALEEFNKVLVQYPNSTKAQDAMLKVGYVEYELGSYGKARKALNDVIAHYPNTTVAKLAATRLDKMQKEGR